MLHSLYADLGSWFGILFSTDDRCICLPKLLFHKLSTIKGSIAMIRDVEDSMVDIPPQLQLH